LQAFLVLFLVAVLAAFFVAFLTTFFAAFFTTFFATFFTVFLAAFLAAFFVAFLTIAVPLEMEVRNEIHQGVSFRNDEAPITVIGYNLKVVCTPETRAGNTIKFILQRKQFRIKELKTIIL
jgi:hypothetical protein